MHAAFLLTKTLQLQRIPQRVYDAEAMPANTLLCITVEVLDLVRKASLKSVGAYGQARQGATGKVVVFLTPMQARATLEEFEATVARDSTKSPACRWHSAPAGGIHAYLHEAFVWLRCRS